MRRYIPLILLSVFCFFKIQAQTVSFDDHLFKQGFTLENSNRQGASIEYSVTKFIMQDVDIQGETMKAILLDDHFLPGEEGAPDLPGSGRFIAIPQGAKPVLHIKSVRKETYRGISVAPAPKLPTDLQTGPLVYEENKKIYETNAFYPSEPVKLSSVTQIRGIDAVILGITPFQYNPVTKELVVLRDFEVEITFEGGNGQFGDERLRSRWWEPMLSDMFLNYSQLPTAPTPSLPQLGEGVREGAYGSGAESREFTGAEYIIISPDGPEFQSWADSIRRFRTEQGILSHVFTISEVGEDTPESIEAFINNAYNTWEIPPAACLLLGDYGSNPQTSIISNELNDHPDGYNPYASDNPFADVNDDLLPDIVFSRITARNASELSLMVGKFMNYERNPPTSPDFYDHPITALGWQTDRWFQICSEAVGGYFKNVQGKNPVRINEVYDGDPTVDPWSTASNTQVVLDAFGPDGLGYITATPGELGGFSGGNAADINNAVNSGSFLLQHRDHGYDLGWGEPAYSTDNIPGLNNTDLTFVMSINCQTGKFDGSSECFAEKFHRHQVGGTGSGALGLVCPTEVSYSFVNDVFVWGMYDNLFPDFLPQFGSTPEPRGVLPSFGCAAGKYFLYYSDWPAYPELKEITIKLFHHHGDAFNCVYTEVPQNLTVTHDLAQIAGTTTFDITADAGSLIALSVDGELIGVGTGTGSVTSIPVLSQNPPSVIKIVVTKQNYYRYEDHVPVIPPVGPFVIPESYTVVDPSGNNNGHMDYGETISLDMNLKNLGSETANNVVATILSEDAYVTINNNTAEAGTIEAGATAFLPGVFSITASGNIPNGHVIVFNMQASNGDTVWNSSFSIKAFAPKMEFMEFTIIDVMGNDNGKLDPGETVAFSVTVKNTGAADAFNVSGLLSSVDPYIQVVGDSAFFGDIPQGASVSQTFRASAAIITPPGHQADFSVDFSGDLGISADGEFSTFVGLFPILILDLDPAHNSADKIQTAIQDWRVFAEYATEMPADLSQYRTIFVCLGTYSDNHVLADIEAEKLIGFLQNGGNLYMEGADTWYYDQLYNPTPLHPYFNITGITDGASDLSTIDGIAGTLTDGLSFYFTGENSYIDHIEAIEPAVNIFNNVNPEYFVAVSYDEGTYKTIGSSFEFGGLFDNQGYTKKNLMKRYLDFFGMEPISQIPETPEGDTIVCSSEPTNQYSTHPVPGAEYYIWELNPEGVGTIDGWDTVVNISWTAGYTGPATLRVSGMNQNGLGPVSTSILVNRYDPPTATISFTTTEICEGDTTYATIILTGERPWLLMVDVGGEMTPLYSNKTVMNDIPFDPAENTEVTLVSVIDGNGCTVTDFPTTLITVDPLPTVPAKPTGYEYVGLLSGTQTIYNTIGADSADSYQWQLDPAVAGTLTPGADGKDCTVDWVTTFTGTANLSVKAQNECGESEFSDTLAITVANTYGIDEFGNNMNISIFPNPNKGHFQLIINGLQEDVRIKMINSFGDVVYHKDDIPVNEHFSTMIDLTGCSAGIYYLQVEGKNGSYYRKVVVE
jgi:hypothetical protein